MAGQEDAAAVTRVAVVEDDRGTREALRLLIEGTSGFACVATFVSVEDALKAAPRQRPDVILLDINLPGIPGSEGVEPLQQRFPDSAILMLTVFEDEGKIIESLCRGARGYVLKKTAPARLLEYIREAARGGAPISPEIAAKVIALFRTFAPRTCPACALTAQEVRFLGLLAEGYSYQGAARELGVSINTVRNYVRAIYDKLHVHSRSAAVSKAMRSGMI